MESIPVLEEIKRPYEPWLDLKKAMDELKIDHTDPDFKEEDMKAKFKEISEDRSVHFWERKRF